MTARKAGFNAFLIIAPRVKNVERKIKSVKNECYNKRMNDVFTYRKSEKSLVRNAKKVGRKSEKSLFKRKNML